MQTDYKKSLYIDGKWLEGTSTIVNINPSDISDKIGDFAQASVSQVEQAIKAANVAQPLWEATPLEKKVNILQAIGDELIQRSEELGTLLAREEGKTKAEGKGEIYRAGQFFQYYSAEVLRQIGENARSVRPGVNIEITREAVGVVGIISPWNFPTATAVWKIAPALCYGNAVIWKPANVTPASAVELAKIIDKHDLPNGTFNLILGSGRSAGEALINSKDISALSFTGSVEVGRGIAKATAANFVKCQLEMGSKNALVIADDADIDTAITCTIGGSFGGTGQKCTASARLVVFEGIYDKYLSALTKKLKTLKVGHALEEGNFMGPVVDEKQLQSNLKWVQRGKELGATLVFGGKQLKLEKEGFYMEPTLFTDTKNEWDINQEEVFAPLACIIKVKNLCEAIKTVNDTRFGLTAGIVTKSLEYSAKFKKNVKSGCVMVNLPTAGTDYHVPFGGRKESSFGPREQGSYAKEFYTVVKTAYQKPY